MTKSLLDAKSIYSSLEVHGPNSKGLLTPNEQVHKQRLDAAGLLARFCSDSWANGNVLDIGCGYGDMIPRLKEISGTFEYTGIDITDWILRVAVERYGDLPNTNFEKTQLRDIPKTQSADLILMLGILATVNDSDFESVMNKAWRLTSGAIVVSWTEKKSQYQGKLQAHYKEQISEILGPEVLSIAFEPGEPHRIALWTKK
jgi:ubiquinone/menaquinone biosynthesis C-methylase UbiE